MTRILKVLGTLLLGMAIVFGMKALPVQAAETWEAPEWSDPAFAEFKWKVPDDVTSYDLIGLEVIRDGQTVNTHQLNPGESYFEMQYVQDGYLYFRMPVIFSQSGSYTVRVVGYTLDDRGYTTPAGVESPFSDAYNYTLPDTKLPTPTNLRWEDRTEEYSQFTTFPSFAYAICDDNDNAAWFVFRLYDGDNVINTSWTGWSIRDGYFPNGNQQNLSNNINDVNEHRYSFTVQAIPKDVSAFACSEESPRSPIYTVSDSVEDSQNAIISMKDTVDDSNVDDKVDEIKSLSDLDTAIRTSADTLNAIDTIEQVYKSKNGITEEAPTSAISDIDATQIEVTGAALNVAPGTSVGLNISAPTSHPELDSRLYKSSIVFDMGIQASDGTDFSQNLDIPVTIKLPVPTGYNMVNTKILHFRADGSFEAVPFRQDGNYIVISVYHFSTFAFAQEATEAAVPVRMHRLYNPNSGEHFYTGSDSERDNLVNAGWNYEGPGWDAPANLGAPVYRFYNRTLGDHHYTMDASEVEYLNNNGWEYEGVAWNSAPEDTGKPLYRLYNPNAYANGESGAHHYTLSETERDNLAAAGWNYEGVAWFSL